MTLASLYENAHAARIGDWKLRIAGGNKPRLYNLEAEPDELTDRVDRNPIPRRMLSDAVWIMRAYNKQWKKSRWGNAANVSPQFAADMGE